MKDFNITIDNVTANTDMIEEDVIKVPMESMEYEYFKNTLKYLKDLAQSVSDNEDSVFADERGVAEHDTREIIDTLLNLEL